MKKALLLVLALTLILSLAACGSNADTPSGNGGNNSTNPPASQGGNNTQSGNNGGGTAADLTTVAGWLSYWDLTEDDLKCAHFTRLDKTVHSMETGEIKEVSAYINKKLTDDEAKAWIEKVIAKLNSMAAEGKLENILVKGEALTADYIMAQDMYIGSGNFTFNGKKVTAMISVVPTYLDSDDPDDAMAACSLKLSY